MESASEFFSRAVGSSAALVGALTLILSWVATMDWPESKHDWNDVIYKLIVIFAFLRVFFLERAHYKEMQATQVKLNELIGSQSGASNKLIGAERAPQRALEDAIDGYEQLKQEANSGEALSIEMHPDAHQNLNSNTSSFKPPPS